MVPRRTARCTELVRTRVRGFSIGGTHTLSLRRTRCSAHSTHRVAAKTQNHAPGEWRFARAWLTIRDVDDSLRPISATARHAPSSPPSWQARRSSPNGNSRCPTSRSGARRNRRSSRVDASSAPRRKCRGSRAGWPVQRRRRTVRTNFHAVSPLCEGYHCHGRRVRARVDSPQWGSWSTHPDWLPSEYVSVAGTNGRILNAPTLFRDAQCRGSAVCVHVSDNPDHCNRSGIGAARHCTQQSSLKPSRYTQALARTDVRRITERHFPARNRHSYGLARMLKHGLHVAR